MHDIRSIRDNPNAFIEGLARRGVEVNVQEILEIDASRRANQTIAQKAQATRNELSKQIGDIKRKGGDVEKLMQEVAETKAIIASSEEEDKKLGEQLTALLSAIPNIPAPDTPDGKDEKDNKEIRKSGHAQAPHGVNKPKQHFELGEALGLMDFETAAKLSGARFTMLRGALARLERALYNFMLDTHTKEHGYMEISPPLLVHEQIMYGTGQLPKFAEDQFKTTHGLWLIPTSEVPLTNIVNGDIVEREKLPLRFTAKTPCFRAEAGAAGKDTRGMLRQHQFYKVEMVSITAPDQSNEEHERMTACAEAVLKKLELPFRTVVLCTGDMGFSARKTYDIEVWLPGQNAYREISSCSNCGDFQARRMNARTRRTGDKNTELVHTLNGSGVAVGRCLIAIMENFQQPDGSISIPAALQPYMDGLTKIEAPR
jgi:seryl-tRNA synthetase